MIELLYLALFCIFGGVCFVAGMKYEENQWIKSVSEFSNRGKRA